MNNMETGATVARFPGWLRIALIGRNPKRTLIRATALAVFCFLFFKFFFFKVIVLPVRIEGNSMFPTYHDRGINFVNRLAYRHSQPQRGDVVGIRMAGPSVMLMKRIVGMPGETIAFEHGRLFVNGEAIPEPYLKTRSPAPFLEPVKLDTNEYYVIGDNRMNSDRGRIDRDRIMGKIVL
ncbi:MAG TPA: signal peptidase I [Verrucomicrobiae bacterium]|jgi:signal peptidase I|nr:signal peptidase I [Verrucomicrobiae bacterium]